MQFRRNPLGPARAGVLRVQPLPEFEQNLDHLKSYVTRFASIERYNFVCLITFLHTKKEKHLISMMRLCRLGREARKDYLLVGQAMVQCVDSVRR